MFEIYNCLFTESFQLNVCHFLPTICFRAAHWEQTQLRRDNKNEIFWNNLAGNAQSNRCLWSYDMDLEQREGNERRETPLSTRGDMEEGVQFGNLAIEKIPGYHLCSPATTAALMGQPANSKMRMKLQPCIRPIKPTIQLSTDEQTQGGVLYTCYL